MTLNIIGLAVDKQALSNIAAQRTAIRRRVATVLRLFEHTDFHVNVTETLSDGARVFTNGNRRTLPHGTVLIARSRDISHTELKKKEQQATFLSLLRGIRV